MRTGRKKEKVERNWGVRQRKESERKVAGGGAGFCWFGTTRGTSDERIKRG